MTVIRQSSLRGAGQRRIAEQFGVVAEGPASTETA
jgi:hypothetical protein